MLYYEESRPGATTNLSGRYPCERTWLRTHERPLGALESPVWILHIGMLKAVSANALTESHMLDIPDELLCLFSATVEETDDTYVIEIPKQEIRQGAVQLDATYRLAMFAVADAPLEKVSRGGSQVRNQHQGSDRGNGEDRPPVAVGDERTVEIEDIGEQGDGIARVERGYVVVVPDTEQGERVTIRITDVTENVGFGEVLSRQDYYE